MKSAFIFGVALFAVTAHVQGQSAPDGVFIGSGEDRKGVYTATVQLRIREATNEILPTYPFTGTIVFRGPAGVGNLLGLMRGDVLNDSDSGTFRYSVPGTVRRGNYDLEYNSSSDTISLILLVPKLGFWVDNQRIVLERRVSARELTGDWAFSDGNVMTVTKAGSSYRGSYRGTAASGHPDLFGSLSGRLRRATWKGSFNVQENDVQASDTFSFRYHNESPPKLKGSIGPGFYTLVKQDVGLPFP